MHFSFWVLSHGMHGPRHPKKLWSQVTCYVRDCINWKFISHPISVLIEKYSIIKEVVCKVIQLYECHYTPHSSLTLAWNILLNREEAILGSLIGRNSNLKIFDLSFSYKLIYFCT